MTKKCERVCVMARVQAADLGLQPWLVGAHMSVFSIPLCYYRPRNCGGGSYERRFYLPQTTPAHDSFLPRPARTNLERGRPERTNEHSLESRPTAKPANAGQPLSQPGYSYSFSSARRLIEGGRRAGAPFFLESSFLHRPEISSAEHPRSTRSRRKGFFQKKLHSHFRRAVYDPPACAVFVFRHCLKERRNPLRGSTWNRLLTRGTDPTQRSYFCSWYYSSARFAPARARPPLA